MKRLVSGTALLGLLTLLLALVLALLPASTAHAQATPCIAAGSGAVNWSDAFSACTSGEDLLIPAGLTVVLDTDVALPSNLTLQGTLDAASQQKTLTLTGATDQTISGPALNFYHLVVNKDSGAAIVTLAGGSASATMVQIASGTLLGLGSVGNLQIESAGTVELNTDLAVSGDFTSSGWLSANGWAVNFTGSGEQKLTLHAVTVFGDITVSSTTILVDALPQYNNAILAGNLTNHGIIRKTQPVAGPGALLPFGLAGLYNDADLAIDVTDAGTLTAIQVDRIDAAHPNAPAGTAADIYWKIAPAGSNYKVDIRLPYGALSHPLACSYSGGNWSCAAASAANSLVLRQGVTALGDWAVFEGTPTVLTLAAIPNPAKATAPVTLTATLSPAESGLVQFYVDGNAVSAPQQLAAGSAAVRIDGLAAGSYSVAAKYGGYEVALPSEATLTGTLQIEKADAAVSITGAPNPAVYSQPVRFDAVVSAIAPAQGTPTGAITFAADNTPIEGCTNLSLDAGSAHCTTDVLATGSHVVTAMYGGDANFNSQSGQLATNLVLTQATPTVVITGTTNPSAFLDLVVLTATVSGPDWNQPPVSATQPQQPTGTVTFTIDGVAAPAVAVNGTATISTTALAIGQHQITADYGGDANYLAAAAAPYIHVVNKAATVASLTVSPNPARPYDTVYLTATIAAHTSGIAALGSTVYPTGTVVFTDTTGVLALSATLYQGMAAVDTSLLPAGVYTVVASYGGSPVFLGSASEPAAVVVKKYPTSTTITSSGSPVSVGAPLSFTLQVVDSSSVALGASNPAHPTGAVLVSDPTAAVNQSTDLINGSRVLNAQGLASGTYTITATYLGDERYAPSTSAALVQVIERRASTASVAVAPNPAQIGDLLSMTTTVRWVGLSAQANQFSPTGSVDYWANGSYLGAAELALGQAVLLRNAQLDGTYIISATYRGNDVYTPSVAERVELNVDKRSSRIDLATSPNPSRVGEAVVITATIVNTPTAISPNDVQAAGVAPGVPKPSGAIAFFVDGNSIGSSQLHDSVATLTYAGFERGEHTITATYVGDKVYRSSQSTAYTQIVNPLPIAVNDAAGTLENQRVSVPVLANDKDPAGRGLSVAAITQPLNGVAAIDPASADRGPSSVTYSPNPGFAGLDSFTYTTRDANGNTDDAVVAVVVAPLSESANPSTVALIDPQQETHTVFTDTHSTITLIAPIGVYTGSLGSKDVFYLAYTPILTPTGDITQQPDGFTFGNYAFRLDAFLNGEQLPDLHLAQPITLTIAYDPAILSNVEEETLLLYFWTGATWSQDGITVATRDFSNHTITVRVEHLGEFAFFSSAIYHLSLPLILNSLEGNPDTVPPEPQPQTELPFIRLRLDV